MKHQQSFYPYLRANNEYMKNYDRNKKSSRLKYWDVNDLYGLLMSQKVPIDGFKWVEEISQFNRDFMKSHNEESNRVYFLEAEV